MLSREPKTVCFGLAGFAGGSALGYLALPVCFQQGLQGLDAGGETGSAVCVGDVAALGEGLHRGGVGLDIRVLRQDPGHPVKGPVSLQPQAVGVVDEGIPGQTCGGLICLAEAAVDYEKPPAGLYRTLSLFGFYGGVTVYYPAPLSVQTELL